MMRRFLLCALLATGVPVASQQNATAQPADTCEGKKGDPAYHCPDGWKLPGEKVSVDFDSPGSLPLVSPLNLVSADGSKKFQAAFSEKTSPLSIEIPKETAGGTYNIELKARKETPAQGDQKATVDFIAVAVTKPTSVLVVRPAIASVLPNAAFSEDGYNQITVIGSGFDKPILLATDKFPTPPTCLGSATTLEELKKDTGHNNKNCVLIHKDSDRQVTLIFANLDPAREYFKGSGTFSLLVGDRQIPTNESSFSLINYSHDVPITAAIVVFALLILAVFLLLRAGQDGLRQKKSDAGKDYWLDTLFLDAQTASYSLSKCQFYAWTAAAVLGYLYLAISKGFIQGSAIFPDIPSGLPGIILASAGTAVVSTGITSSKGDKGAGDPSPNLSDFIASGGVVAADRLQFVIWTLVGIGTFLALVLQTDPRSISDLPPIPNGFLELMGISSAGYIAGKLTRKAGPTIKDLEISGKLADDRLTFRLTGSGLSRSASFTIDDKPIYPDTISGANNTQKLPDIIQVDPVVGDPDFARILEFSATKIQDAWLGGPHNFTIINPDGQKSSLSYQKFKVTEKPTLVGQTLTIKGQCLDDKLKVTCTDANGDLPFTGDPTVTETQWQRTTARAAAANPKITVSDTSGTEYSADL